MITKLRWHHVLLMIDACHSGALQHAIAKLKTDDDLNEKLTNTKRWFFNRMQFRTRLYITSTAAERASSDGINHSPFASMFVKALRSYGDATHVITANEIFGYIEKVEPPPIFDHFKDHEAESSFFFIMK